jgi:hypothetical protein
MPQDDYIPRSDSAFDSWLKNLAAKCEIYSEELGLSSQTLKQIQDYAQEFSEDVRSVSDAKVTLASRIAGKDQTRRNATDFGRSIARQVKSIPNLPPSISADLGVLQPSSQTQLASVRGLNVIGYSKGVNSLKWRRGENSKGTLFVIEYQFSEGEPWHFADVVTRTNYEHAGQIPGRTMFYRVTAKRAKKQSAPSPSAVVYPGNVDVVARKAA